MPQTLQEFVEQVPVIDVHEHHLPELFGRPGLNLIGLFRQSYAGWAVARPYTLPNERREADPMLVPAGPSTWEDLEPFLEQHGSNSFVRNLVWAVTQLYGQAG